MKSQDGVFTRMPGKVQRVAAVRQFNRFYTRQIGLLQEGLLDSPFSLTEVRVMYELGHRGETTAKQLADELGLDTGYLSRILRGFKDRGLITRNRSKTDGRQSVLRLTAQGRKAYRPLDRRSDAQVAAMLGSLTDAQQKGLVDSMSKIEGLLRPKPVLPSTLILRSHRPGDMGWIVHRHGILYSQEYGWDERFEALVAEIAAKFIQNYDPRKERCWIAERDGEIVGSVFLVKRSSTVAQLRLMFVEPNARGLGIGKRLVAECLRFAREARYKKVTLWTNSVLLAARHIYKEAGFQKIDGVPHKGFGHDLVAETWELRL
jgi:DNA-binding MarR family transcriptional regulator/N-acetylglutamate synthase-like GNAT family acetyltransferase